MKVLWHDAANADADEAAAFYFDKHPGLGRAYIDELDAAVQRCSESSALRLPIDEPEKVTPVYAGCGDFLSRLFTVPALSSLRLLL